MPLQPMSKLVRRLGFHHLPPRPAERTVHLDPLEMPPKVASPKRSIGKKHKTKSTIINDDVLYEIFKAQAWLVDV